MRKEGGKLHMFKVKLVGGSPKKNKNKKNEYQGKSK